LNLISFLYFKNHDHDFYFFEKKNHDHDFSYFLARNRGVYSVNLGGKKIMIMFFSN
jgi:hypothetical protein